MPRLDDLVDRYLDAGAVAGYGPAIARCRRLGDDLLSLTPAFADRAGLLVLTAHELCFVAADGSDEASVLLERVATAETAEVEGRPVLVLLAADGRRTLFHVGDAGHTATFAELVNLALDDAAAARFAAGRAPGGAPPPPAAGAAAGGAGGGGAAAGGRTAAERLRDLQRLLDEGLVTREEYEAKRTAIIAEL